jgi:hypothetical protein
MFKDYFHPKGEDFMIEAYVDEVNATHQTYQIDEAGKNNIELDELMSTLRKNNIKVKVVNPTNFGTELVLYKDADIDKIKEIYPNIETSGKSVFLKKVLTT